MQNARARNQYSSRTFVAAHALGASFLTYLCMYGLRKPFTAAAFDDGAWNHEFPQKEVLLLAQVIGYALSKFLSVRLSSELPATKRAAVIIAALACAEVALLLLPIVAAPWRWLALFFNGLPLGLVWGLVFAYLEGRRSSDLLGAGLAASYILGSGVAKSVGRTLLDLGVAEVWMPVTAGLLYFPLACLGIYGLTRLPPPSEADLLARQVRVPMRRADRQAFWAQNSRSLLPLCVLFFFLTAYREYRDSFMPEILAAVAPTSALRFTVIETWVALGTILVLAGLSAVSDHRRAVWITYALMSGGVTLIGVTTIAHQCGWLGGGAWMVGTGIGLYVAYVPFGSILFERWIAVLRSGGNALYAIALCDAMGYLGAVAILLAKPWMAPGLSRYEFFCALSLVTAITGCVGFGLSALAFAQRLRRIAT